MTRHVELIRLRLGCVLQGVLSYKESTRLGCLGGRTEKRAREEDIEILRVTVHSLI